MEGGNKRKIGKNKKLLSNKKEKATQTMKSEYVF